MSDLLLNASDQLCPMDVFVGSEPLAIDLVYADAHHPDNIFGTALYHPSARLSVHVDLARVLIRTARDLYHAHRWTLIVLDGFRPVDAQRAMTDTPIVRQNPQWLQEPRLLSPAGMGGHPRGMAVDVRAQDKQGHDVDMGTRFDEMTPQSARGYDGFSANILKNRQILERAMLSSANVLDIPLIALSNEWWDFRFPPEKSALYAPLGDADVPPDLRMTTAPQYTSDFSHLAKQVLKSL